MNGVVKKGGTTYQSFQATTWPLSSRSVAVLFCCGVDWAQEGGKAPCGGYDGMGGGGMVV